MYLWILNTNSYMNVLFAKLHIMKAKDYPSLLIMESHNSHKFDT